MNPVYLISFISGTSGKFLEVLTSLILSGDKEYTSEFIDGVCDGRTHTKFQDSYNRLGVYPTYSRWYDSRTTILDQVSLENLDFPYVFAEHPVPNWDLYFIRFPNLINIIITLDERTVQRQILNMAIKNNGVPISEVALLKKLIATERCPMHFPYNTTDVYANKNNIVKLPYYDLIHKKDEVLTLLSDVTGLPIHDNVINMYENYLAAQYKLYPWFDDK